MVTEITPSAAGQVARIFDLRKGTSMPFFLDCLSIEPRYVLFDSSISNITADSQASSIIDDCIFCWTTMIVHANHAVGLFTTTIDDATRARDVEALGHYEL